MCDVYVVVVVGGLTVGAGYLLPSNCVFRLPLFQY